EPPLYFSKQRVIAGLADVFKTAVGVDACILWEWTQRLTDRMRVGEVGFEISIRGRHRRGRIRDVELQLVAQREEFGVQIVDLRERRTQASCARADIAHTEDQIRRQLA